MMDFPPPGHGWHPSYGICGQCFLFAMFGSLYEPWPNSKAIYGINCSSERQPDPDWDAWMAQGHEGWPPPMVGATVIEIVDDDSLPF
jgi:hypothetical protein